MQGLRAFVVAVSSVASPSVHATIESINREKIFEKTVVKIEILKVISVNVKTETLHYPLASYAHRLVLRHLSNALDSLGNSGKHSATATTATTPLYNYISNCNQSRIKGGHQESRQSPV